MKKIVISVLFVLATTLAWRWSMAGSASQPPLPLSRPATGGPAWETVLPDRPTRIWRPAHYPISRTLYVTTDGDLRRTVDDGDTWAVLYPTAPLTQALGISSMAFDPGPLSNPALFVARNPPGAPAELLRSTDDGLSWTTIFTATAAAIQDVTAVRGPAGQLIIFAAGGPNVWRSLDGGEHWHLAVAGLSPDADLYRIYASPAFAHDQTLFLTGFGPLWRSTDGGESWTAVTIPAVDIPRHVVFSPRYATDQTLWISYFFVEPDGVSDPNGVARSTDGGQTWQLLNDGLPVDYLDGWILGLAVSPDYPHDPALYAVERALTYADTVWQLYRAPNSDDGWIDQNVAPDAIPTGLLAAAPDQFFLSTQAGLYRLRTNCWGYLANGGAERNEGWEMPATPITAGYSTAQAHTGARSLRIGLVGGPDRYGYSSARQRVDLPATAVTATVSLWLYPVTQETGAAQTGPFSSVTALFAPNAADAQYVLLLDEDLTPLATLLWQRSNAQSWQQHTFDLTAYLGQTLWLHIGVFNDGIGGPTGLYADDVAILACQPPAPPAQPATVHLPIIRQDWSADDPPTGPLLIAGQPVSYLAGHPDGQALYALAGGGLYRSDDGARHWQLLNPSPPVTNTLVVAPGWPDTLYGGPGYPCYQGGPPVPMWRSLDGGVTWSELPAGVNRQPLAVHPADPARVYARGCDGPWYSDDGGESWSLQGSDLFLVHDVRYIAPAPADDWQTVYLGTATEGGGGGLIGSHDGGTSWSLLSPLGVDLWWVSALAVDPDGADRVYFGEPHAFWGSHDGGGSWYTSTTGLEAVVYDPAGPITQTYGLLSLGQRPGNPAAWLLGTVSGIYQTTDYGLTWQQLAGLPDEPIAALLLRTIEPNKLFLTTPDGVHVAYLDPLTVGSAAGREPATRAGR